MKFKVGDKVRVKKGHVVGKCEKNGCAFFQTEMKEYVGKVGKVIKVRSTNYALDIDDNEWGWSECMLEKNFKPLIEFVTMNNKQPVFWECTINNHSKFWAAHIIEERDYKGYSKGGTDGVTSAAEYVLVRKWGRIGNRPQTMEQRFDTRAKAESALKRLIWAKENKGYKPVF